MAQQVMLSVRGEARRTIAPDFVTLHCGLGATARSKADAIAAALDKGRDYATALGGTLTGVEHVADAGLLGSGDLGYAGHPGMSSGRFMAEAAAAASGPTDTPSLDPTASA